jgi:hypothetical protein
LLDGKNRESMLTTANTRTFLVEAANAATALPCPHSVDSTRRPGYVQALAGRRAS